MSSPDPPILRSKQRQKAISRSSTDKNDVRTRVQHMLAAKGKERDVLARELGDQYLYAAERGNDRTIKDFLEAGFPVKWQDPDNGLTALHVVAACQARKAMRLLLATDECDFLVRDKHGRLPSEMAYLHGEDIAVARLLGNKERKQAQDQGIKLTRRPVST